MGDVKPPSHHAYEVYSEKKKLTEVLTALFCAPQQNKQENYMEHQYPDVVGCHKVFAKL